jgi:pyruvate dehydrogenase E2 component (dihydrolipoamide acetyltransferase)
MEIPSTQEGVVLSVAVKVGSSVKEGDVLLEIETASASTTVSAEAAPSIDGVPVSSIKADLQEVSTVLSPAAAEDHSITAEKPIEQPVVTVSEYPTEVEVVHAGPAVRRLARELGVSLVGIKGSGPKERILKEDVHAFVKQTLSQPAAVANSTVSVALPVIDFSKWGEIERVALTKIQKVSAQNLHRAWITIPHVTQFDEADITELEAFRVSQKDAIKKEGLSLTVLSFLVKASAHVLKQYPKFASSLENDGETLIRKKYIHIGVAVDTPNGLVVPVIRDADKKSIRDIAKDLGELSAKARDKKLTPAEMQGAVFSISSLGGIGGTAFTPIVNWPEVAILGVSRSATKPVWDGTAFQPRLMLPLSLSYDHRVIDGADAARFTTALAHVLSDIRQMLL